MLENNEIPMMVHYVERYDENPVYDIAYCPICGYQFDDGKEPWGRKFCPACGQRLKWEG